MGRLWPASRSESRPPARLAAQVLHQPLRLPGLTKAVSSLAKSGQARKAALAVRNSPINPDIKLINAAMP